MHAGDSRLIAPVRSATSRPSLPGEHLLVGLEPLIEELLNRLEQLHAVLFHNDRVRAFAYLHVALVGRIGQLGEVGVQHVARQVGIPLGVREEGGDADPGRIVQRLARTPELAFVLHNPVGRAQHRGRLLRAHRVGREGGVRPCLEPARWDQVRLLVLRHAREPAALRSVARNGTVSTKLAARVRERPQRCGSTCGA